MRPERRPGLTHDQRRVLDGGWHALRPGTMPAELSPRHLIDFDLDQRILILGVGDLTTPTHLTWQISGMNIGAENAAWGAAREAAQLHATQQSLDPTARPLVICWLGYRPPNAVTVFSNKRATHAGVDLAAHMWKILPLLPATTRRAIEAHSYGTLVALRALGVLDVWAHTRPDRIPDFSAHRTQTYRIDELVLSGSIGVPEPWLKTLERLGTLKPARTRVTSLSSGTDWLATVGRVLSRRKDIPTREPFVSHPALTPAKGHNTTRPDGAGYRDMGTESLVSISVATLGRPTRPRRNALSARRLPDFADN